MYQRHVVTQLALTALLFFSCTKESTEQERLKLSGKLADGTGDATTCYTTYLNTIKNPPKGYVPLTAEHDLANCQGEWSLGSPSSPKPRLYPPPPELTPVKVVVPHYTDQRNYLAYFGLNAASADAEFKAASNTFIHFASIECDAISALIDPVTSPSPTPEQKRAAGVVYTATNPEAFASAAEKERFIEFLVLVFPVDRSSFVFYSDAYSPRTGLDMFTLSPYWNCINFRIGLSNLPDL